MIYTIALLEMHMAAKGLSKAADDLQQQANSGYVMNPNPQIQKIQSIADHFERQYELGQNGESAAKDMATVPKHIKAGIDEYVSERRTQGSFIMSVLQNDLRMAIAHSDHISYCNLAGIVRYCWNNLPQNCWGSEDKVEKWLQREEA